RAPRDRAQQVCGGRPARQGRGVRRGARRSARRRHRDLQRAWRGEGGAGGSRPPRPQGVRRHLPAREQGARRGEEDAARRLRERGDRGRLAQQLELQSPARGRRAHGGAGLHGRQRGGAAAGMDRRQAPRRRHRGGLGARGAGESADRAPEGARRPERAPARGHHRDRAVLLAAGSGALARPLSWLFAVLFFASIAGAADLDAAREAQKRGTELHLKRDFKGALAEFDRAVALAPDSDLAWYNRGLVHRDLRDCRSAVADFDRALALQPEFFNALYQRANCLQQLGEYTKAVDDYSRAIAFPGRVHARFLAHFGRADALRRLGRLDEAYVDYTRVTELRSDTRALSSRAWVQYYRGRWRDAHRDAAQYLHDTEGK